MLCLISVLGIADLAHAHVPLGFSAATAGAMLVASAGAHLTPKLLQPRTIPDLGDGLPVDVSETQGL